MKYNINRAKKNGLLFSGRIHVSDFKMVFENANQSGHMDIIEDERKAFYSAVLLPGNYKEGTAVNDRFVSRKTTGIVTLISFMTAIATAITIITTAGKFTTGTGIFALVAALFLGFGAVKFSFPFVEQYYIQQKKYANTVERIVLKGKFQLSSPRQSADKKKFSIKICDMLIEDIPAKSFLEVEHIIGNVPLVVVVDILPDTEYAIVHVFKFKI